MKSILAIPAAIATLTAGTAFAQTTVVTEPAPVIVTQPTTATTTVETDPGTSGGGAVGGGTAGAVAGAIVGGPVGAAVGGAAGAILGDVTEDATTPAVRTHVLEHRTEPVVLDTEVTVGARIPESAQIQPVPDTPYQYVYVEDRPVLVDPESRQIIYIYE